MSEASSMTNVDRLLAEAINLTDEERAELTKRLAEVAPMDRELDRAWREEAKRRFAEYEAGRMRASSWADVRQRVFGR